MNVYRGNIAEEGKINSKLTLLWDEPVPLKKHLSDVYMEFFKNVASSQHLLRCPSIREEIKNTFVISSPIDITINWDGSHTSSPDYDQRFFDEMFHIKPCLDGTESRLMSILLHLVFFADKKCDVSMLPAYFSDTEFQRSTMFPAGRMDLNSWFRPLDIMFFRHKNIPVVIKKGDPLYYLKFHTEEDINFNRFEVKREIITLLEHSASIRQYTNILNMESIYSIFNKSKIRNRILKLIKQNLF
jgi:hypothetical protein